MMMVEEEKEYLFEGVRWLNLTGNRCVARFATANHAKTHLVLCFGLNEIPIFDMQTIF